MKDTYTKSSTSDVLFGKSECKEPDSGEYLLYESSIFRVKPFLVEFLSKFHFPLLFKSTFDMFSLENLLTVLKDLPSSDGISYSKDCP